ncbi:MAG: hypothetical protein K6G16_04380, partial [Lachnospiraceae bacterium]|nr:hypothetical protein [Lachnospiraceae bacterium]
MNNYILNAQTMRLFLEGKREGRITTIMELVADGLLDEETGADRLNMTIEDFQMHYNMRKRPKKFEPADGNETPEGAEEEDEG